MGREQGHLETCRQQLPPQTDLRPDPRLIVSLEAEVPELLFEGMRAYIEANPRWDQYSLVTTALASFLFQNGCADRCVVQHYLDGLFQQP